MAEARAAASPSLAPPPWSERLFASVSVSPLVLGGAAAAALLALFFVLEFTLGGGRAFLRGTLPDPMVEEYRFALVLCLLAGYAPAAYAYAVANSRRTLDALGPALSVSSAELQRLRASAGRFEARALRRAGLIGAALSLAVPFLIDLSLGAYNLRSFHFAALYHRILLPLVGWPVGRFIYATLVDSSRLSRLGREGLRVDLLDLAPLAPLTRYGLRNALLVMGFFSVLSLLVVDWQARPGLPGFIVVGLLLVVTLAAVGLLLPVRGARDAIRAAKRAERIWCRDQLHRRRSSLEQEPREAGRGPGPEAGAPTASLAELVAWRQLVESVREWPFDLPTLMRFTLYLAIPLGSWLGGAFVERLLDKVWS